MLFVCRKRPIFCIFVFGFLSNLKKITVMGMFLCLLLPQKTKANTMSSKSNPSHSSNQHIILACAFFSQIQNLFFVRVNKCIRFFMFFCLLFCLDTLRFWSCCQQRFFALCLLFLAKKLQVFRPENKKSVIWPIYGTKSACLQNKKDRPPK